VKRNRPSKTHSSPLRHPPLSEVVFEITFNTRVYAVENRIADFQQRVMETYPDSADEFVLHIPPAVAFGKSAKPENNLTPVRSFVFKNAQGTRTVRVSVMGLNVTVSDYLHFDDYKTTLMAVLGPAVEIFELSNIQRVGLRYVNKIAIPPKNASTTYHQYVRSPIDSDVFAPHSLKSFLTEISLELVHATRLTIRSGLLPEQPDADSRTYLLDLDCSCQESISLDAGKISTVLDEYHETIETEFKRAMTKKLWDFMAEGKAM
jgi:uncharacterized protein (TIGR04255 family)